MNRNIMIDLHRKVKATILIIISIIMLSGCQAAQRLANIGTPPSFDTIKDPLQKRDYRPVSMPMPQKIIADNKKSGSLWRSGAKAFFKDHRASRVGDILTVLVSIADSAKIDNQTETKRDNSEDASATKLLGYETKLDKILPDDVDPTNLLSTETQSQVKGNGKITRTETIKLKIASTIIQTIPNGNLVIYGKQQFRVNNEMRDVQITGIIRPQDVTSTNTINFDNIAEARIAYGGKGHITDVQEARYGQQVLDVLMPF